MDRRCPEVPSLKVRGQIPVVCQCHQALPWEGWGVGRVAAAPTELLTPEGVAHPNWTPVLGTLSAEQGGDKACFDDFKKRKNTRLPPWAASQDVKGTTRCPLLPSAQSWLVKGSLAPPRLAPRSLLAPSGGSPLCAGQHGKPLTWIISFNPLRCLHDGQCFCLPRFLGLRF